MFDLSGMTALVTGASGGLGSAIARALAGQGARLAVSGSNVEKLEGFVKARGHSMVELAFSWLAARPTVASIIAGATKPEQIAANVRAAEWPLTAEDMNQIDGLTKKD